MYKRQPLGLWALGSPFDSLAIICSQVDAGTPVRCAISCAACVPTLPAVLPLDNCTVGCSFCFSCLFCLNRCAT